MKKKRNPMSEGALKDIFDLFFKPLVKKYNVEQLSTKEFMEDLFDVDNRFINKWQVKKAFTMPGLFYIAGAVKVQGLGYRKLSPNTILWVRTDARNPQFVDIEFQGGQGGAEQVFSLTQSEWNGILPFISCLS